MKMICVLERIWRCRDNVFVVIEIHVYNHAVWRNNIMLHGSGWLYDLHKEEVGNCYQCAWCLQMMNYCNPCHAMLGIICNALGSVAVVHSDIVLSYVSLIKRVYVDNCNCARGRGRYYSHYICIYIYMYRIYVCIYEFRSKGGKIQYPTNIYICIYIYQ